MKNLLIMRHAKSDWSNQNLSDFNRPLNKRGKRDAPMMGQQILKHNKQIDLIISSPANRALHTVQYVAQSINYTKNVQLEHSLYHDYINEALLIIQQINNNNNTVLLIGHNPTMEMLVSLLLSDNKQIVMTTATIASLLFDTEKWQYVKNNTGKSEWLIRPKDFK